MASISFDEIREAVDKKFAHLDVKIDEDNTVRFLNALQLPKDKRAELAAVGEKLAEDGADELQLLGDALRVAAEDIDKANIFLDKVGDNLAFLVEVFNRYQGDTEAPEA